MSKPVYFWDAGHGGHDSGAVNGNTGAREKTIALTVAALARAEMERTRLFDARLTRDRDVFLTLRERAEIANRAGGKLISIHCNAGGGRGFEAFTAPGQSTSDVLATALLEEYGKEFPEQRMRVDLSDGDPDKEARFTVLTKTRGPAVLFELGFIDTEEGERFLTNTQNQERMAKALVRGVRRYEFGVEEEAPRPPGALVVGDGEEWRQAVTRAVHGIEEQLREIRKVL